MLPLSTQLQPHWPPLRSRRHLSPESLHLLQCCPISSVSCTVPSFFGSQLQCYLFKEDCEVCPIRSLALFPSECLGSQRSQSFISLCFHYWSPGWKGKLLKCRGCTRLFFSVSSEPDAVLGTEHMPRDTYWMSTWSSEWEKLELGWYTVVTWNYNYYYHAAFYDCAFRSLSTGK